MADPTRSSGFFKSLLDSMQIGIIVADARGILIYINETYARFLNIDIEKSLGRHATEVVANSRLHIVAETGRAEINQPHRFKKTGYLVQRIPIRRKDRVIAAMGIVFFDSASTADRLAEKLVFLETKLKAAQNELASIHATRYSFDDIIGDSQEILDLKRQGRKAAGSELPVLITGESGTGKELFAQAIHRESPRRAYPFVRVNCAAIPGELFESELFGYEKGAFSGAHPKGKSGKFELANLGTIFLDEVGDMPIELQPKLLRVLELKEFERVGGNRVITSDFRVIAATNVDLEQAMEKGRFRRDLYYRLNGIPLSIKPLRRRQHDIGCLTEHFLDTGVSDIHRERVKIDPAAVRQLESYRWPGNARELMHVLEQAVFTMTGDTITEADLPEYTRPSLVAPPQRRSRQDLKSYMRDAERHAIEHALKEAGNNKTAASEILGIHRTLLYRKMRQLGMIIPAAETA